MKSLLDSSEESIERYQATVDRSLPEGAKGGHRGETPIPYKGGRVGKLKMHGANQPAHSERLTMGGKGTIMEESSMTPSVSEEQESNVSTSDITADWHDLEMGNAPAEKPEERTAGAEAPVGIGITADWPEDKSTASDETNSSGAASGREADQSFTLKHLGEVRKVGKDEVITLAQKGLDYDRQRQKNDELASRNRELSAQAEQLRAQRVSGTGTGPRAMTREEAMTLRRDREVGEFLNEYGSLDPKTIPQEVWQAVTAGKPLLTAYQAWELKKLRVGSSASVKAVENREKSAGSRASAGNERHLDAITADWYSS